MAGGGVFSDVGRYVGLLADGLYRAFPKATDIVLSLFSHYRTTIRESRENYTRTIILEKMLDEEREGRRQDKILISQLRSKDLERYSQIPETRGGTNYMIVDVYRYVVAMGGVARKITGYQEKGKVFIPEFFSHSNDLEGIIKSHGTGTFKHVRKTEQGEEEIEISIEENIPLYFGKGKSRVYIGSMLMIQQELGLVGRVAEGWRERRRKAHDNKEVEKEKKKQEKFEKEVEVIRKKIRELGKETGIEPVDS